MTDDRQSDRERVVLLVDDEPDVRRLTGRMLKRSGYEVIDASDGREALDLFAEHRDRIGVVLLDVMMPVMTGHEAIAELRRMDRDLPVVFFSGYDRSEVAEHLADPSAPTLFLAKPFTSEQLTSTLETALGRGA